MRSWGWPWEFIGCQVRFWCLNPLIFPFFPLGILTKRSYAKKNPKKQTYLNGKWRTILLTIEQAPDNLTQTHAQEEGPLVRLKWVKMAMPVEQTHPSSNLRCKSKSGMRRRIDLSLSGFLKSSMSDILGQMILYGGVLCNVGCLAISWSLLSRF